MVFALVHRCGQRFFSAKNARRSGFATEAGHGSFTPYQIMI